MIITRRIEVYVKADAEQKKAYRDLLFNWLYICRRVANLLSSHLYVQDNITEMIYLTEDVKAKLADASKYEDGILQTSYQNAGYRLLSSQFKGKIPTSILTNLNNLIFKSYKKEKSKVKKGEKSLRSYKKSIPIPIHMDKSMFTPMPENRNYLLNIHNIPMATAFRKDRSGNTTIVKRALDGEYKIAQCSLKYNRKNNKWFLLFCVELPNLKLKAKKGNAIIARLDLKTPIIARCGRWEQAIGTEEEYLHQRVQIQEGRRRLQKSLKYASGGNGRKQKLKALERYTEKEKNYIQTKMHTYSKLLIMFAVKNKAETIILEAVEIDKESGQEKEKFLLRNWGYYGLKDMITYKANYHSITVEEKKLEEATVL